MLNLVKRAGYFGSALVLCWACGLAKLEPGLTVESLSLSRQLLQEGTLLYQQGSFAAAQDIWRESAALSTQKGDILGRALALNNIALAYQQLGAWQESGRTIAEGLMLLKSPELINRSGYWSILAKVKNTQGNWQLQSGQTEIALASWQEAAQYYDRTEDKLGKIKAQINQSKALQALGANVRAVKILERANNSLEDRSDFKAVGLRYLGIGFRNLGKLEQSEQALNRSIELAATPQDANLARLELGNTYRQQSDRVRTINKPILAREYFERAIELYETLAQSDRLYLRARLNQLSLLVMAGQSVRAESLLANFDFPNNLEASRSNIYALLNYAHSLTCLRSPQAVNVICQGESTPTSTSNYEEIVSSIQRAIAQAEEIQDSLARAQALSQLAEVYELQEDYKTAKTHNQTALLLLESKSAPEVAYRLQWQLGRILRRQQQPRAAKAAYQEAIISLERVRDDIIFIDPQAQFSFRDRVEPVYREYADLVLTRTNNQPLSQQNLRQAIEAIDSLQLAELENFLRCDLSQLIRLDETTVDTAAAQIYPIVLDDRLITIIEIPNQPLQYREISVERSQIETAVNNLLDNLTQPARTPEVLEQGQQLYQWLITPLESILEDRPQIETLVLLPDSLLRNVPFGVLYDGEEYLLEKGYAFAVSPRLELFAPSPATEPLKVLTGGVELAQTIEGISFPPIAQVEQELNRIATEVETNQPLLNNAFTSANIERELNNQQYSAIHWKTHGVFSSDPASTFLVAYQDSIKANDLQSLVQTASRDGQQPIELLVLSACETAKGDDRAILGLAGLTVRTGARTALSSYWRADDRANTLLMTYFYRQLSMGTTKAEALRQAQLYLIREEGYFAPHYWGTYVLVGNWL